MTRTSVVALVVKYPSALDGVTGLKRPTNVRELLPFAAVSAAMGFEIDNFSDVGNPEYQPYWAAEWHRGGVPTIEIGHKLAAAMICTSVPVDTLAPWPFFALIVPSGLLHFAGRSAQLVLVSVGYDASDGASGELFWFVDAEFGQFTVSSRCTAADLAADRFEKKSDLGEDGARVAKCLLRLVINACASFDDPRIATPRPHGKPPFREAHRPAQPYNRAALYRLGHPVKVDCRPAVADYIAGRSGRVASVRWIVRGHWTNQPHGPGSTMRRRQWIEPYWKGRDDAPINVRSHQFKGDALP